jgi:hypothetical protein
MSLEASHVAIEPNMPVGEDFINARLPRPGAPAELLIRAQLPQEEAFLGSRSERAFHVGASDKVVLVMLGSQPTVQEMYQYFEQSVLLGPPPDGTGTTWVFLACGYHTRKEYRQLYQDLASRADTANAEAEAKGGRLRVIPFSGQPAKHLEARADVTVTRSGGMVSGELLALATQPAALGRPHALLHVNVDRAWGLPLVPPKETAAREFWEQAVLEKGMVEWEADNARYLKARIGARLVSSASFLLEAWTTQPRCGTAAALRESWLRTAR